MFYCFYIGYTTVLVMEVIVFALDGTGRVIMWSVKWSLKWSVKWEEIGGPVENAGLRSGDHRSLGTRNAYSARIKLGLNDATRVTYHCAHRTHLIDSQYC